MPLLGTSPAHRYWLSTNAEGLGSATLTWAPHPFCWRTTAKLVVGPWLGLGRSPLFWCYTLLFNLSLASHARAMWGDPGCVPPGAMPPPREAAEYFGPGDGYESGQGPTKYDLKKAGRWCSECHCFKPRKAHHNNTTNRCIVKLDHWCPWVSNAVGIRNHKHFILFCGYHCLACALGLYLIVSWLRACRSHGLLGEKARLACDALVGLLTLTVPGDAYFDATIDTDSAAFDAAFDADGKSALSAEGHVAEAPAPTPLFFDGAALLATSGRDSAENMHMMPEGACDGGGVTVAALFMVQLVFGCFTLYLSCCECRRDFARFGSPLMMLQAS